MNENSLGLSWGRGKKESEGGWEMKEVDEEKDGVDIFIKLNELGVGLKNSRVGLTGKVDRVVAEVVGTVVDRRVVVVDCVVVEVVVVDVVGGRDEDDPSLMNGAVKPPDPLGEVEKGLC